jgi:predicted RNase H-like HicB family nuclease
MGEKVKQSLNLSSLKEAFRDQSEGFSGWFARIMELPGCITRAEAFNEPAGMLQDAMQA